jgi:hypothetical protein
VGSSATPNYRHGDRSRENVLTAEVLTALDYLPRNRFLGAALAAAHGDRTATAQAAHDAEVFTIEFLPEVVLNPQAVGKAAQVMVQPDGCCTGSPASSCSRRNGHAPAPSSPNSSAGVVAGGRGGGAEGGAAGGGHAGASTGPSAGGAAAAVPVAVFRWSGVAGVNVRVFLLVVWALGWRRWRDKRAMSPARW